MVGKTWFCEYVRRFAGWRLRLTRPTKTNYINNLDAIRRPVQAKRRQASFHGTTFVSRLNGPRYPRTVTITQNASRRRRYGKQICQAFFSTSLTISTASFSMRLRCSSPRKLSQ